MKNSGGKGAQSLAYLPRIWVTGGKGVDAGPSVAGGLAGAVGVSGRVVVFTAGTWGCVVAEGAVGAGM